MPCSNKVSEKPIGSSETGMVLQICLDWKSQSLGADYPPLGCMTLGEVDIFDCGKFLWRKRTIPQLSSGNNILAFEGE